MVFSRALWFQLLSVFLVILSVFGQLERIDDPNKERLNVFVDHRYYVEVDIQSDRNIKAFGLYTKYNDLSREILISFTETTPYYLDSKRQTLTAQEFSTIANGKDITFRTTSWKRWFKSAGIPEPVLVKGVENESINSDDEPNITEEQEDSSSSSSSSKKTVKKPEKIKSAEKLSSPPPDKVILQLPPKLSTKNKKKKFLTLFMDLDDTLTVSMSKELREKKIKTSHFSDGLPQPEADFKRFETLSEDDTEVFTVRPGVVQFLKEISKIYKLVLFTRAGDTHANHVLTSLGIAHYFKEKLYYDQCTYYAFPKKRMCKDIDGRGGDIKRLLLIDDNCENCKLQGLNGIVIPKYEDELKAGEPLFLRLITPFKDLARLLNDDPNFDVQGRTGGINKIITSMTMVDDDKIREGSPSIYDCVVDERVRS